MSEKYGGMIEVSEPASTDPDIMRLVFEQAVNQAKRHGALRNFKVEFVDCPPLNGFCPLAYFCDDLDKEWRTDHEGECPGHYRQEAHTHAYWSGRTS